MAPKRHRLAQRRKTVGHTQESLAEKLGVDRTTVVRWERAESAPQPWIRLNLANALAMTVDQLDDLLRDVAETELPRPGVPSGGRGTGTTTSLISEAADAISNDPFLSDRPMPHETVESLQDDMAILARSFSMTALDVFTTARWLSNEARSLAKRTRRPGELADLYTVIGQGTALMASTAFDLGHWNDSAAFARASTRYADLAGQPSLMAWTLGLQMTLANWRNEPDAALAYFAKAMRVAPDGEPKLRLRHIAARSYALLADPASVAESLEAARRDRELAAGHPDELNVSSGGEFAFGPARAAACAAAAWLDLGEGGQAIAHAQEALDAYTSVPSARWPYSQICGVQIDLAAARLCQADRDGAADAVRNALALPQHRRNTSLTGRMTRVQRLLGTSRWEHDERARQLAEQIAMWLAEQSAAALT
ncbi:helix-turn-helix domain-containing protein [Micromonospora sp. NBC_01655]|uniref:helix-turn-helix transcriptional regulator n=1 Tax=Micromonospora sp. NBC_01655 TaxID=2975983 RepID=UPI0022502687|nr:helix-turn-helix transcriptional regulator [Micromonospora sp. NBC_01655]MCX4470959.1 helix-turn-helix domain-containing protein [Micromonospora sp. NBC_01655]